MNYKDNLRKDWDVIVIGSGLAGLCAGIAAAECGASVLIIEKMGSPGGTSALSVGAFAVCRSNVRKGEKKDDSHESFYKDIMAEGEEANDAALVKLLVSRCAGAFKFVKNRGARYGSKIFAADGHSAPRCFQPPAGLGQNVVSPLLKYFLSLSDTAVKLDCRFTAFVRDQSGRIAGVETETVSYGGAAVSRVYSASSGVILASGGFARDPFFASQGKKTYRGVPSSTSLGADAETMKLLMAEGVKTRDLEWVRFGTSIACNDIEKGMLVECSAGKRFVSESSGRSVLAEALLKFRRGNDWPVLIFDSKTCEAADNDEKIRAAVEAGELQSFGSVEELSAFYGIPSENLKKSAEDYNLAVKSGTDGEFGKDFVRSRSLPLSEPPFYGCSVYPKLNYTQGGVVIDEKCRVLLEEGRVADGLFACGEITGGIHGKGRLPGCSVADCAVFGILAGTNAAGRAR